jgi:hypothetical protein
MSKNKNPIKKRTATRIVRSFDTAAVWHRAGITSCPHCDHNADDWEKTATTLVLATIHGKHGSVVVVNECPKCFEKSWVHQPFSFFDKWTDGYSEEWKAAANAEYAKRHLAAVTTFADSLCARCSHLRSLKCDTLPIVECTKGNPAPIEGRKEYLHGSFTEKVCDKFLVRPVAPET